MKPDISEDVIRTLLRDVDDYVGVIEDLEQTAKELIDYVEFLEDQLEDIKNENTKGLVAKNIKLKKALNMAEELIKFGTKNEGQCGKTEK